MNDSNEDTNDSNKDKVLSNGSAPILSETTSDLPSEGALTTTAPSAETTPSEGALTTTAPSGMDSAQASHHTHSDPLPNRPDNEPVAELNDAREPVYRPNPLPLPNQSRFIPSNTDPANRNSEIVHPVKNMNSTLRRRTSNRVVPRPTNNLLAPTDPQRFDCWRIYVNLLTFCCLSSCLKGSMPDPRVQYAWKEKIALCSICLILCGLLGFITFGLTRSICNEKDTIFYYADVANYQTSQVYRNGFILYGKLYDLEKYWPTHNTARVPQGVANKIVSTTGVSISNLFGPKDASICSNLGVNVNRFACSTPEFPNVGCVHNNVPIGTIKDYLLGPVTYRWPDIVGNLTVYQSDVLDMTLFFQQDDKLYPPDIVKIVREHLGNDLSFPLAGNATLRDWGKCLTGVYKVGQLEDRSVGCFISDVILWVSLIVILSVVLIRFAFAMLFSWFISRKLGKLQKNMKESRPMRRTMLADGIVPFPMFHQGIYTGGSQLNLDTVKGDANQLVSLSTDQKRYSMDFLRVGNKNAAFKSQSEYGKEMRTIMLVTCYSEGEDSLRKTFDSLAETKYNEDFKLLFIVADGIITGSGNTKSTPELIIDMLEMDSSWPFPPPSLSYFSLADGSREHNKAKVYAAWYNYKVEIFISYF